MKCFYYYGVCAKSSLTGCMAHQLNMMQSCTVSDVELI